MTVTGSVTLKIVFFCYIAAPYWPISAKFGKEMTNHYADVGHVTKHGFSQIHDGGRPPF